MKTAEPDTVSINALEVLQGLRKGRMVHELSEKLEELTAAIRETNQKGSLTLKLSIDPLERGDAEGFGAISVVIRDDIKISKPEPKRADTIFFASRTGSLTRNNPDQMEMEML